MKRIASLLLGTGRGSPHHTARHYPLRDIQLAGSTSAGMDGPGGGEGGQSAAGLSKTFTLSDGGSFFNGLSPTETTEASET